MTSSSSTRSVESAPTLSHPAHHGVPRFPDASPGESGARRSERTWKAPDLRRPLRARRRRLDLDEIPEGALPVILELFRGKNFVILLERVPSASTGETAYLVQFPDRREALVQGGRLRAAYDGVCVLVDATSGKSGWRSRLASVLKGRRD